ncbi:hypothetical protein Mgra_00009495, partial [Meloidogyne graminicola]
TYILRCTYKRNETTNTDITQEIIHAAFAARLMIAQLMIESFPKYIIEYSNDMKNEKCIICFNEFKKKGWFEVCQKFNIE